LAYLLLLSSFLLVVPTATTAEPLFQICDSTSTNYTANSTFESNLNAILSSLPANGFAAGFFNGTAGDAPARVYGLVLCRGDVSADDCRSCLDTAAQDVLQVCPRRRSAIVWYDYCMLWYSDRQFSSVADVPLNVGMINTQNLTEVAHFNRQLNLLMQRLVSYVDNRWARMFVTGEAEYDDPVNPKIYGLVQCAMYQSADDCNTCLMGSIGEMPNWAFGRRGARYLKATCNVRYELYSFYKGSPMVSVPLAANASPPTAAVPPAAPPSPPIDRPAVHGKKSNSTGTVLAIVIPVGVAFALIPVIGACLCRRKSKQGKPYMRDAQEITAIESLLFDLSTLRDATGNFSELNLLGQGGFGSVYKGLLSSGQEIAVKRLLVGSGQGVEQLKNEVVLLAKLQHRKLVRLIGVCLEGEEKLLVYEYVPNRSLDKFLFDPAATHLLKWGRRYKIIVGIALGLQYLHQESQVKIIHRDLKASNILLDADMNPKISDFGLARFFPGDQTQASTTRVVGTFGYMAPEYVMRGQFSSKSDVFSFGVLVLEIVTGQRNTSLTTSGSPADLLGRAWEHWRNGTIQEIIDPSISGQCQGSDLMRCIQIGLLCVQEAAADRPTMSSVVLMLSSESVSMRVPSRPAFFFGHSQPAADAGWLSGNSNISALVAPEESSSRTLFVSLNEVSVSELEPRKMEMRSLHPQMQYKGERISTLDYPSGGMEEEGCASPVEAPIKMDRLDTWSPQEIPYHVLVSATNNFSEEMILGKGGFGPVYRGFLTDLAVDVAIKKLSERSQQGLSEYMAEVKIITQLRHRNLVKLFGWCQERGELLLVYEFVPNGSLDNHLFKGSKLLDWSVRYKIVVGLANALTYLHDECDPCVLHRDIKSSNVLLDSKFDAKLGDFGLAKLFSIDESCLRVTHPAGTRGYWAPEYVFLSKASRRSDVYSFGVVALEIACGRKAILVMEDDGEGYARLLVEWVWELYGKGSILDAADKRLNGDFDQLQMERLLLVGLWCAQPDPRKRPWLRQAMNALLFPETTPLPELPKAVVSWAYPVASMRMQTLQRFSNMPASSPKVKAQVKPKRWSFPQFRWWTKRSKPRSSGELLDNDPELKKLSFKLSTLRLATANFSDVNLLGEGGYGAVYRGRLLDGLQVAVKKFLRGGEQAELEWRNQVAMFSKLQHRNLVRQLGLCTEEGERMLVYEYASRGDLGRFLFDPKMSQQLGWGKRYKIVQGITRGLQYLHEGSRSSIVHRNLSATAILLDAAMNPKIAGFLFARVFDGDQTHLSTSRIVGTFEYMSPEYVMTGRYSNKLDVFSFGVLVLEIVTGRRISTFPRSTHSTFLTTDVWWRWIDGTVLEIVDPALGGQYQRNEVMRCIQLALLCVQDDPNERPTMSSVVDMLGNPSIPLRNPCKPGSFVEDSEADTDCAFTCKASRGSDVYSFGVVALEIACGKKAILVTEGEDGENDARLLVEWVWELHGKGSILDAADKRLNGNFEQLQMERLLLVGLWCAQPDPRKRPSMRQANDALLFPETNPPPDLPRAVVSWAYPVPASMQMQTVQLSSKPASSPTLTSTSDVSTSSRSRDGNLDTSVPQPKGHAKPKRWLYLPRFTWWTKGSKARSYGEVTYDDPETKKPAFKLSTQRTVTALSSGAIFLEDGGFGKVYKGLLPNGQQVAVKRFSAGPEKGVLEWRNQVALLSKIQHRNLARLLGLCIDRGEKFLVYEYEPNGTLDRVLFDPIMSQKLDWGKRCKIIEGIARGLQYLHDDSQLNIIHMDVNPRVILLDAAMNPKISDFELSRVFDRDQSQGSTTRLVGTLGYMSPEYVTAGRYSDKSDVFSFGVLVLEIVTGQRNLTFSRSGRPVFRQTYVWEHWVNGTALEVVDPSLGGQYQSSEVVRCIQLALLCVQENPSDRPTMHSVVLMLTNHSLPQPARSKPGFVAGYREADMDVLNTAEEPVLKWLQDLVNEVPITELEPR
ncbi:hypothetical protein Taro_053131, partial [Colocasia esculenta]|nr:hypothetical protein [Colocasia esculenta]